MIAERLRAEHILAVRPQAAQKIVSGEVTPEYAAHLASLKGVGWAIVEDNVVFACGGIVEKWPGSGQSWAIFSDAVLQRFRPVHRLVTGVLRDAPWTRIEMDVDAEHVAGIAWAERLGFVNEGLRRKYTVDGRDVYLFARVR